MKFRFAIPVLALCAGLMVNVAFAKKEYTAKEKKACSFCHKGAAPKDGKDLNKVGEYYKTNKKLPPAEKK
jgi:cytochrome c551/c552